ncbi:hypothetical protein GQF01_30180 [Paenibacillus sp. 5J-6]|uniref:peptidylprolyl isomerase n=1 Tax=Paenibacillus silvestris TaxID=2606219 RepID=A0A6L8V802_9BACL|nr:peptidylprolyl isomerase [Paenibacillus silvestris]MZQ86377.1 hypothetical protein [Paenibacillus silvestris]
MSLAFFGILILIFMYILMTKQGVTEHDPALTVNNEPIAAGEFRARLSYNHVAKTYSYFKDKYGVDPGKDFWTTTYGSGESPISYAREATLNDEVRTKVQQILMKQNGILTDISYEGFLKSLADENHRRQEAVKKGQIVYGPTQYGENEFFDYQFSNSVFKLKEKLYAGSISEDDLKRLYEKDREEKYQLPDYIKIQKIVIPFGSTEREKQKAEQSITLAKTSLNSGSDFESVAKLYSDNGKVYDQIFDETTAKRDGILSSELITIAATLEIAQVSKVIETRSEFILMKCLDKKQARYQSFEAVRTKVQSDYMDKKYNALIDKLVGEANIQKNASVYNRLFP